MNKFESKYFATAAKMDEALIRLLDKKPFEYITVKEICTEAGVNRSTFYLHYENTDDLLKETLEQLIGKFCSYFGVDVHEAVNAIPVQNAEELVFIKPEYIVPYLQFIKDNKKVFEVAFKNPKYFEFENTYKKLFENVFDPILEKFRFEKDERQYVMSFYLNGIFAIASEWVKNGCKEDIEDISEIITKCIYGRQ